MKIHRLNFVFTNCLLIPILLVACKSEPPKGIAEAQPASTTVVMDFYHKPLPNIPLPNDLATRYDAEAKTLRRVNASMIAPTEHERQLRTLVDQLDGWGVYQPITIPFSGPIDVGSILAGHRDINFNFDNDVIYLVNVDKSSPSFGALHELDLGNGNFPMVLERTGYYKNDPRGDTLTIVFEEVDEDKNDNGLLDPGEDKNGNGTLDPGEDLDHDGELDWPEDTDADGVLDKPNYLPGLSPAWDDLAGRTDATMLFYEDQTNTVIARPIVPLEDSTTYAVVVTRRLLDTNREPVGSPYAFVNHISQTPSLMPLLDVLPEGLEAEEIAFAFSFTTQSIDEHWIALRDGLYGHGVQKHLGNDFPAEVAEVYPVKDLSFFDYAENPYVLYREEFLSVFKDIMVEQFGQRRGTVEFKSIEEGQKYIDYQVIGRFRSPQLFERMDGDDFLPLNAQSWPPDLATKPAEARSEDVFFWLTVPRKEISARGEGKPVPVVIVSHGYGSSRLEMMMSSGYFAKHGLASIAIDCVSHGIGIPPVQVAVISGLAESEGLSPFIDAAFQDRAHDLNNDHIKDPGADYWTSYLFHTRDAVRQSALDYMQLARVLRSFDGVRRWQHDLDGDGEKELAGDFDGDGVVDIGGPDVTIGMTGGSLGGIMSAVVGAVEPEVSVIAPIAGGGGLSDVGVRSQQGGVREAVLLRMMAPVIVGTLDGEGVMKIETIIPDLNNDVTIHLANTDAVKPGDSLVIENLNNGERDCAFVSAAGTFRTAVESDLGDALRLTFYPGPSLVGECELVEGKEPRVVIDQFDREVQFQRQSWAADSPFVALAEGYGLKRAQPELRRFLSLAQLILDPADPTVVAPYLLKEPLSYPGTGDSARTHSMIITTIGDMNVPANTSISIGRAAGLIDFVNSDPRYNKPPNQVLIDTYTTEAVHNLKRYVDPSGNGVHIDLEDFASGEDLWKGQIPRLDPPLRLGLEEQDAGGGVSGAIFPYPIPSGQHGFAFPGEFTDEAIRNCKNSCAGDPSGASCGCDEATTFDIGHFMFNMLGDYFAAGGKTISTDLCHSRDDCSYKQPVPPDRPTDQLR